MNAKLFKNSDLNRRLSSSRATFWFFFFLFFRKKKKAKFSPHALIPKNAVDSTDFLPIHLSLLESKKERNQIAFLALTATNNYKLWGGAVKTPQKY